MFDTLITVTIELLFAIVFVASLIDWLRRRDVLSRDVLAIFGSVSALFVSQFVGIVFGSTPPWLSALTAAAILALPVLTLRLAARIRPIPRAVPILAVVAYVTTALPLVFLPRPIPVPLTLIAVGAFILTEFVAAAYLFLEARRRIGAARFRLTLAALATALFATALLAAGAGAAGGTTAASLTRIIALLAALGYAAAFLPPGPLRRIWQGMAAYRYGSNLLGAGDVAPHRGADAVWSRFATAARDISGAEGAAVLAFDDGACRVLASAGLGADDEQFNWAPATSAALPDDDRSTADRNADHAVKVAHELGFRIDAPMHTVITMPPPGNRALVLLARHHSLFGLEDQALISLLAGQAVALADREELYAEQTRLAERLFAASQAKSDFIASMSHELRTPLSAILGFSELMRAEPIVGAGRVVPIEWIEHIHRGGQHLLSLINDVLDLAKVEAGRLELEPATFDLGGLIAETVAGLRPLADRKHITITTAAAAVPFVGDRGRIRQVLYNLLSNAIKFTPDDGAITVEQTLTDAEVSVAVTDNGPGIAAEHQALIFEEFRQVGESAGRREGTGLGLALARRLVEAHGGRLDLVSELGHGSRFTAAFPREAALALPEPPVVDPDVETAGAGANGIEILVIEDDPSAVRLLRTYLEGDGYRVRVASDGPSGLASARANPPAAIILDILLPGSDGWEILREFKADATLRDLPVVIVTVLDERGLGLALGAVDYFLKPVDRAALLDRLARYTFTTKVKTRLVKVLAIDDDPSALDLIDAALRPEGFDVVRAVGGREGIERARTEAFDLVVCDLVMPDVDGFDVVTALKANPASSDTPILILTAHSMTDSERLRLNGQILGIVEKGDEGAEGLRRWLARLARPAMVGSVAGE
jgi:signal transduction histidine kinase/DNA-binding response OmpR family regulator